MTTLRQRLLVWLMSGMLISTLVAGVATYSKVGSAANDLFDYQLTLIATNLPNKIAAQPEPPDDGDPYNDILILIWDDQNRLVYPTKPTIAWPAPAPVGFSDAVAGDRAWRVYSERQPGRIVEIAQPRLERERLAAGLVVRAILPFLILIPALAALIWFTVGRAIEPLRRLAAAVERRSAAALQPLPREGLPGEVLPVVQALDKLLARLGTALSAQRDFVADAAHELRSPLTALKLQLQLAERAKTPEQRAIAFGKLNERLARTVRLVEQLLTLAREEPEIDQFPDERVDLGEIMRQVNSDFSALAEDRDVTISCAVTSPAPILAERASLLIMINNLVDNAVRFTPSGGSVALVVRETGNSVVAEITDSGPGIPPEDRERVFDRFYRREGGSVTGSGLGLAIVRSIAAHHACAVTLADGKNGIGLTVALRFARAAGAREMRTREAVTQ